MAQQETGTNWVVVGAGGLFLALVVLAFNNPVIRAVAAAAIFIVTFIMAQSREEERIENPLLDELRGQKQGLDRRKYGRLRSTTERLLDNVRHMNRIAIEGREGKLAPRHAHAELDRLAAVMRDIVDEARKSAGVPTPIEDHDTRPGKVAQPKVVMPKAKREEDEEPAVTVSAPAEDDEVDEVDSTDKMLDDLEAKAEAARIAGVDYDLDEDEVEEEADSEDTSPQADEDEDEDEVEEEPEEDKEEEDAKKKKKKKAKKKKKTKKKKS
jgi:hypothetical protein